MPKVSVIVPNYNHAPYLKQRIESILNQSYQDFELILLDDCSTDNSCEVLSTYQTCSKISHCIFNTENSGSTFQQWDRGIELAKGEYIWIAESDDWAEKEFLQTVLDEIDENLQVGLVYTGSRLIDSNNDISFFNNNANTGEVIYYTGSRFVKEKLISSNAIWNASMMVFKKALYPKNDKALFVNMKYCGDWFFYVLVALQGDVIEIRKTLSNFRVHEQNVSTEAEKSGKSFTEGLVVYSYIRSYLSFSELLKSTFEWGKSLYKYKHKYDVTLEVWEKLYKEIGKNNKLIWLSYLGYSGCKILKK